MAVCNGANHGVTMTAADITTGASDGQMEPTTAPGRTPPRTDAGRISPERLRHLLTYAAVARSDTEEPTVISVTSPIDGSHLADVPRGRPADVVAAIATARVAQPAWADVPVGTRAGVLRRVQRILLDERDGLLDLVQAETGKARVGALEELLDAAMVAQYYARNAARLLRPRHRQAAIPLLTSAQVRQVPLGVVGIITPWNYPLTLAISDALAALVAGNAVVLKPDSRTPLTALAMADVLDRAGLPHGLYTVVPGAGAELGTPLIDGIDHLMFTGSTATGRRVAEQCGRRLIACCAELGGKNPMIVLADADLQRAFDGAVWACFSTSGQLCVSIERIYVEDAVYDDFVPALVDRVRSMRLAVGYDWEAEMGSLIGQEQLDAVSAHVADAVRHGASVLAGGRARPDLGPYAYEPTVLEGVTEAMALARAETFGPVVSVYRVRDEHEAVARANDSTYGLNASVWSTPRHGRRVAARLEVGSVNVNEGYTAAWGSHGAPIGGMKESGLGRRHGAEGLLAYTEPQTIATQRLLPLGPLPRVEHELWARWMARGVRAMRWIR